MTRHQKKMASNAPHTCACGEPAVQYKRGDWGCDRCIAIEDAQEYERQGEGKTSLFARHMPVLNPEPSPASPLRGKSVLS